MISADTNIDLSENLTKYFCCVFRRAFERIFSVSRYDVWYRVIGGVVSPSPPHQVAENSEAYQGMG